MNATRVTGPQEVAASSLPNAPRRDSGRPLVASATQITISSGARRVGDPHLERLVVRAHAVVVLVLDRDVDRRAGGAALLRRGQQRRPLDRVAHPVAEAEVVDDRRAVLDLSVEPDERALAVALRLAAEQLERALREQRPERLAVLRRSAARGPRRSARRTGSRRRRRRRRSAPADRPPAAFLVDVLDDRDHLAQTLHRPRIIASRGRDRRRPPGAARRAPARAA